MTTPRTTATAPDDMPVTIMERLVDAPREAVWRAWSTPEAITRWWGPHGTRIDVHGMEFREGGALRFSMTMPGGEVFPNRLIWRELKAPERMAFTLDGDTDNDPRAFRIDVQFTEARVSGDRRGTLVRIVSTFPSMEAREAVKKFGAIELGRQTWDKMADFVEAGGDTKAPDLVMVRTFDAPQDSVWRMWTEPKHFMRWWGPHGFDCPEAEIAPRAGAPVKLAMRQISSGDTHYVWGEVLAVNAPRRLVLRLCAFGTQEEPGIEHVSTVTLSEFQGATTMQLETRIMRLSDELRDAAKGMEEGWSQSFEKMAESVGAK
jgi:uncharacterized protein YndB with AHSA1/START domain